MWTTYWWICEDEDSELCGEECFTELKDATYRDHVEYMCQLFPTENFRCLGQVTREEADMMGLDTY